MSQSEHLELSARKIDEAREVLRRSVPDAYEAMSSEQTEELVRALYWVLSRD